MSVLGRRARPGTSDPAHDERHHDDRDGDVEHPVDPLGVLLDLVVLRPERRTEQHERAVPDAARDDREDRERAEVHPVRSRRQRDETAHDRHEAAEEHGALAVPVEPVGGLAEVVLVDEREAPEEPHGPLEPDHRAEPVEDERPEVGPEGRRDEHEHEVHLPRAREEPGERQDDLGRDRREDRLDEEHERDAPLAEGVDELQDESGEPAHLGVGGGCGAGQDSRHPPIIPERPVRLRRRT